MTSHRYVGILRVRVAYCPELRLDLERASRRWHEAAEHAGWWAACTYISCALDREAAQRCAT